MSYEYRVALNPKRGNGLSSRHIPLATRITAGRKVYSLVAASHPDQDGEIYLYEDISCELGLGYIGAVYLSEILTVEPAPVKISHRAHEAAVIALDMSLWRLIDDDDGVETQRLRRMSEIIQEEMDA